MVMQRHVLPEIYGPLFFRERKHLLQLLDLEFNRLLEGVLDVRCLQNFIKLVLNLISILLLIPAMDGSDRFDLLFKDRRELFELGLCIC